jgi:hypothetical protein
MGDGKLYQQNSFLGGVPPLDTPVDSAYANQRLLEMLTPTAQPQGTYNNNGTKLEPFYYTESSGRGVLPWKMFGGGSKTKLGWRTVPAVDYSKPNVAPAVLPFAEYAANLLNPTLFRNYGRS